MNLCCFLVVEKWTPIVLILDHILQVPLTKGLPMSIYSTFSKLPKVQSAGKGSKENACYSHQEGLEPGCGRNIHRNPSLD